MDAVPVDAGGPAAASADGWAWRRIAGTIVADVRPQPSEAEDSASAALAELVFDLIGGRRAVSPNAVENFRR